MRRDTGLWCSAEYSSFTLGPEADKYRLNVAGYSGDAGDAITSPVIPARINNGMQFTTKDSDNDYNPMGTCGSFNGGAWWFNYCTKSWLNLNLKSTWSAVSDAIVNDIEFSRMMVKLD